MVRKILARAPSSTLAPMPRPARRHAHRASACVASCARARYTVRTPRRSPGAGWLLVGLGSLEDMLGRALGSDGLQQHTVPMKIHELLLAAGEPSHVDDLCDVDSHALQRQPVGNWRDYESSGVLKADESAVEEMINARRKEQPVLTVEPLLVGRIPPRLTVTSHQMYRIVDTRDPTSGLDLADPVFEQPLPLPCPDQSEPICFRYSGIICDLLLELAFPKVQIISRNRLNTPRCQL